MIILFCDTFVSQLIFNVLVGIRHEDLGEDPVSWTHVNSTLTRKYAWPTLHIHDGCIVEYKVCMHISG